MIIVLKDNAKPETAERITAELKAKGFFARFNMGESPIIIVDGVLSADDIIRLNNTEGVLNTLQVQEPYQLCSRSYHAENTVVNAGDAKIGGEKIAVIAGPCTVECKDSLVKIAQSVKDAGAVALRGGTYKMRTSPYSFQGLGDAGVKMLFEVKKSINMPVISEIISPNHAEMYNEYVDIVQVGARNMHNFDLLKEVGKIKKPILLKRGFAATIEELLMSAEYIMSAGNENVILCERGIRTFEPSTRNTLDLSAVPMLKKLTHLPIIVDPSHAAGRAFMVEPLSLAAVAAGADGLLIEVHDSPENALCDGAQAITCNEFSDLMKKLKPIAKAVGRDI